MLLSKASSHFPRHDSYVLLDFRIIEKESAHREARIHQAVDEQKTIELLSAFSFRHGLPSVGTLLSCSASVEIAAEPALLVCPQREASGTEMPSNGH